MIDVLVPDIRHRDGLEVAQRLRAAGHSVHTCLEEPGRHRCLELDGGACPLDAGAVDVAVVCGERPGAEVLGDGGLCAIRHRLPLVLVDAPPDHALADWAVASTSAGEVVSAVAEVFDQPLAGHSAAARKALLSELHRQGASSSGAWVQVFRRPGRLVVELSTGPEISSTQAERMATHLAQAVRLHDRWAPKIDVVVRRH